jgi:hypothetical protein
MKEGGEFEGKEAESLFKERGMMTPMTDILRFNRYRVLIEVPSTSHCRIIELSSIIASLLHCLVVQT